MRKSTVRVTVVFIFLVVLVVGYYAYLSSRHKEEREQAEMTPVQAALSRDLQNDYPATPKEVVKFYNQLLMCFYNEECTEEEVVQLGEKARELYDEELLRENEPETYLLRLQADIQAYRDTGRQISSTSVAASTSVVYDTLDGYSFARILCGYNMKEKETNYPVKQVYLLRKDENLKWKIYGWEDASKLKE